ncbi:hypothetical protein HMPREF1985_01397 [Mitsuokella sp. oral taxon 131 str. W9106]|nr:hypothetical protein HMPREF1985_01397 [Mitsuokella sp. oral taxon 131 str. W9106]
MTKDGSAQAFLKVVFLGAGTQSENDGKSALRLSIGRCRTLLRWG